MVAVGFALAGAMFALATVFSVAVEANTGCIDDDFEPNNDQASAALVSSGTAVAGQTCTGADANDWFSFSVTAGDTIDVELLFTFADGDLDLRLFDEAGNEETASTSTTDDEVLRWVADSSGVWAVVVEPFNGAENAYELTVTSPGVPCVDDGFEPNNGQVNAAPLVSGVQVSGQTCPGGNAQDWYSFPVIAGDVIDVELLFTHADGPLDLFVVDEAAVIQASRFPADDDEFIDGFVAGSSGVWAVLVEPFNGAENSYDLAVTVTTPPPAMCNGRVVTVDLAAGGVPTSGDDVILGTSGADVIVASAGDDTICGEGGDDTINAGAGDDWVDAGGGDDTVFGLDGDDIVNAGPGNDQVIGGNGNDTMTGGDGTDVLNGGPDNDTLRGESDRDFLFAQGGNDTVDGGGGNDLILGSEGVDTIDAGPDDDVVNAGPDDDSVDGGDGNDIILGLDGADTLTGGLGDDQIFGFPGNDVIDGGPGDDELVGNEGDDQITDPSGANTINGGIGNDSIVGGAGDDMIFGDADVTQNGDDTLTGGPGQDTLVGFGGNDTIDAQDEEIDTVNGGPGIDTCTVDVVDIIDSVFGCEP